MMERIRLFYDSTTMIMMRIAMTIVLMTWITNYNDDNTIIFYFYL